MVKDKYTRRSRAQPGEKASMWLPQVLLALVLIQCLPARPDPVSRSAPRRPKCSCSPLLNPWSKQLASPNPAEDRQHSAAAGCPPPGCTNTPLHQYLAQRLAAPGAPAHPTARPPSKELLSGNSGSSSDCFSSLMNPSLSRLKNDGVSRQ
jgi:hypothetical protein